MSPFFQSTGTTPACLVSVFSGSPDIDWVAEGLFVLGAVGSLLYWLLKKALEDQFAKRLERMKHELQTEAQKLSIVYEHQKDSFRSILAAMHKAIHTIEDNIEDAGGDWPGISSEDYDEFKRVIAEERLFIDARAERAISLFTSILWDAVNSARIDHTPDTEEVRRSYNQLQLVAGRLAEYFRSRVGLVPESVDPLLDTELLGACRMINTYHFPSSSMPTSSELAYAEHQSPEELVSRARANSGLLRSELTALKVALEGKDTRKRIFHSALMQVERYLEHLGSVGL